jgi:hypothetical protein
VVSDEPSRPTEMPDGQASAPGPSGEVDADARPATPAPRRRLRTPIIVAIVLGAILATAGIVGLVVYDRATAIDRSTPTVVVGQFLGEAIDGRDPARVALFVCDDYPPSLAIEHATEGLTEEMSISWGDYVVQQQDSQAAVTVQVRYRLDQATTTRYEVESWRLRLVNDHGWRVCGLQRP